VTTSNGMGQEVDVVVTSLKGPAQYLYEDVYFQRGQMENLIKLRKAQLGSDHMACHSATANQVQLVLHTAAYWLMLGVRDAIPQTEPARKGGVRHHPRASDQDRRARNRAPRAHPRPAARRDGCSAPSRFASRHPAHERQGVMPRCAAD